MKVEPMPSALSKVMAPPSLSMIFLLRDSPSPLSSLLRKRFPA